jgi:hypothetical protein
MLMSFCWTMLLGCLTLVGLAGVFVLWVGLLAIMINPFLESCSHCGLETAFESLS